MRPRGTPDTFNRFRTAHAALHLVVLFGAVSLLWGCQGAGAHVDPNDYFEMEQRAMDLLLRAAQSEDPYVCSAAIEAVVNVAPEEGLPRFRAALSSPLPLVRFAGVKALGTLRDRNSLAAFRRDLTDTSPLVRLAAAFAVVRCGQTGAARLLVDALNDHPEENIRAEAAHLIGLLEEPRALKRLRAALRVKANEQSFRVRMHIYTAMARLGDEEALGWLCDRARGVEPLTRLMAMQGLVELRVAEVHDVLLYNMSATEGYLVNRLIAARGLAALGSDAGYELAIESATYTGSDPDDPDDVYRVRFNAALVLGEIGNPRALGTLRHMALNDDDPRVQTGACYAICRILKR